MQPRTLLSLARSNIGKTGSLGVVALATACGGASTSASPSTSHAPMASHSSSAVAAARPFGPDCGMVPASGAGSFHAMAMDPVVAAAQANPLLTTFAADVRSAHLTGELNGMTALTVFAPDNTAFKKVSNAEHMAMMHSSANLVKILKYGVVSGRVTPAQLSTGASLKTLEGDTLSPAKMGAVYEVNKADVICGNITTANATVYIINKVLVPMH